jgi:chemotaxis protein MotA
MIMLGGLAFIFACVFGSFAMSGGSLAAVFEALPGELLTICGAAIGIFVMSNSMHDVKEALKGVKTALKGAGYHKSDYVELLSMLYYFTRLASTKGTMALEAHIERPQESAAFQKFPRILANTRATAIICDYLRMVGMNADDPHQIEDLLARELKKTLAEKLHGSHAMQNMADGLPALGIKTMAHISDPPAVLGEMIGGAMVGTFLGVLLAYGIAGPIATRLRGVVEEESKYFEVIRAVLVTHLHGNAPQISVETGRKMAPTEHMPSFQELETAVQDVKV